MSLCAPQNGTRENGFVPSFSGLLCFCLPSHSLELIRVGFVGAINHDFVSLVGGDVGRGDVNHRSV